MTDTKPIHEMIATSDLSSLVDIILQASSRLANEADQTAISKMALAHTTPFSGVDALHTIAREKEKGVRTVLHSDVIWEMDWTGTNPDGSRKYPDKQDTEEVFEKEAALALLLMNEVIFLNEHHWEEDWPSEARKTAYLGVIANDVFAWGCSDAEGASPRDLETIYRMWTKDPVWGPTIWCITKRRELPQRPIANKIQEAGVWDLDALTKEHDLRPNHYDGISSALARQKYAAYSEWALSKNREPLPYAPGWWAGWKEFTQANPSWYDEAWKASEDSLRSAWRSENGFA